MCISSPQMFHMLFLLRATGLKPAGRFLYMSTRKVYEGEWVGGTPKCGEYRDMPPVSQKSTCLPAKSARKNRFTRGPR